MSDKVKEMADAELIQAYQKGKEWLVANEQVTGTDKNKSGEEYEPAKYFAGLSRIEDIEREMVERGVKRE